MTPEQSADERDAVESFRERESAAPARTGGEPRRGGFLQKGDRRPSHQLAASSLATIVAIVTAIASLSQSTAGFLCSMVQRTHGAHVAHGSAIVIFAGLLVLIAGIITRNRPRLFAAVLLVEVAALTNGLVLVVRDAARTKVVQSCGFFDETTTTKAGHVAYLYVMWSAAGLVLLWQAFRGLRTASSLRFAGSAVSALAVGVALGLVPGGHRHRVSSAATASVPSKGVLICRDAFQAPKVFGGWQCENNTDIGTAPLPQAPKSVLCSADVHANVGDRISVQAFYFNMLLKHGDFKSSDVNPNAYVEIDPGDMSSVGNRLPEGSYRCRFYVNRRPVHVRSFQIGTTRYRVSRALTRYHYALALTTLHGRPRANATTHVGDEFAIDVSSSQIPAHTAVPVSVCVNTRGGDSCYSEYILHGHQTQVDWQVDKREGVGSVYRLMIEASGRPVAARALRLERTQP